MIKTQKQIFILIFFTFCFIFFNCLSALAAELYLETSKNQYYTDETFVVDIRINVEHKESINAVECYLEFPNDILEVKDFSTGNSILTFIESPKIDQQKGLISFIGIIPGGYIGRIAGDPGKSNLLGKIIFQAISSGSAQVVFQNNSQVLLNDGKGTSSKLSTKGVSIEVKPSTDIEFQRDEWQEKLEKDKTPPEDFKPEIVKIDDKYYLVFNTKDKGSGIDYYEVLEKSQALGLLTPIAVKWIKADNVYLLKDQSLNSEIQVKAVDKAGNERIVKLPATYSLPWYKNYFIWAIIILATLGYIIRITWPFLKRQH